ncbi:MAG TPA: hypothetical protein VK143_02140, partial [Burkholderiales bacterium]|nr:hypothetical protein [Burkholderiales bacterium]
MPETSASSMRNGAALVFAAALALSGTAAGAKDFKILQPLGDKPAKMKNGGYYVPTTTGTARWGSLPNADSKPVLTVPSGSIVTF